MRLRLSPVLLVAVVAIVAGCGGSGKKAAAPSSTSPAPTGAASTAAPSATTSESTAPSSSGGSADCKKLADLGAQFGKAMSGTNPSGGTGDPAAQAEAAAKAFQDFADQVPSEIRGDFETFATALGGYAKAMAGMHLTAGKAPSAADMQKLGKAVQVLSTPELTKASAHLTAWAQKNCGGAGFGTTTP